MKTIKLLKSAALLLALHMIVVNAHATSKCSSDKSDINEDTKKIAEKLSVIYGVSPIDGFEVAAPIQRDVEKIYDEQELKVDRSLSFLNQVNSVGIVSDTFLNEMRVYGTAVMISPCHVLINAHAAPSKKASEGIEPVYISLGQSSCESNGNFLHQNMLGKVIAIGNKESNSTDYAVVRINELHDVKPSLISTEFLGQFSSLMMVGFPFKSTYSQKKGLQYPTANFARVKSIRTDGTFILTNTSDRAGGSGSGIFVLDDNNGQPQTVLGAIYRGEGGIAIQTAWFLQHLKLKYPLVFQELRSAIQLNTCFKNQ